MRRLWPLIVVGLGAALASCWDFEGAYNTCVDTGRCSGGGGGDGGDGGDGGGGGDSGSDAGTDAGRDGGADAGPVCPPGSPDANGLCLIARYDRDAPMYGLYGPSPDFILFGGNDEAISTWQGGAMDHGVTGLTPGNIIRDLSGISQAEVWAAVEPYSSAANIYRYDGASTSWSNVTPTPFPSDSCYGVWAEDAGYAFLACTGGLWRITAAGTSLWQTSPSGVTLSKVWGIPSGPAWVVGGNSTARTANIVERRGGTWSNLLTFPDAGILQAVHGRSDHDVWAVGDTALLMHLDDAGWHTVTSALAQDLSDVFVTSAGEVWVTAYTNRVLVIAPDGGQRTFVPPGIPGVPGPIAFWQVQVFDSGDVWFTARTDDGGTFFNGAELHYRKLY